MFIFVGLGNPGPEYSMTRHNIGFMLMDALADNLKVKFRKDQNSLVAKVQLDLGKTTEDALLVKPQTFMNLSGQAVQPLMAFYKIPLEKLMVVHDEVDLPFGQLKLQKNRGHAGHNGIRDIHAKVGMDYARLRLGVGRPTIPQISVADFVLQNFSSVEMDQMSDFLSKAADSLYDFAEKGVV